MELTIALNTGLQHVSIPCGTLAINCFPKYFFNFICSEWHGETGIEVRKERWVLHGLCWSRAWKKCILFYLSEEGICTLHVCLKYSGGPRSVSLGLLTLLFPPLPSVFAALLYSLVAIVTLFCLLCSNWLGCITDRGNLLVDFSRYDDFFRPRCLWVSCPKLKTSQGCIAISSLLRFTPEPI